MCVLQSDVILACYLHIQSKETVNVMSNNLRQTTKPIHPRHTQNSNSKGALCGYTTLQTDNDKSLYAVLPLHSHSIRNNTHTIILHVRRSVTYMTCLSPPLLPQNVPPSQHRRLCFSICHSDISQVLFLQSKHRYCY